MTAKRNNNARKKSSPSDLTDNVLGETKLTDSGLRADIAEISEIKNLQSKDSDKKIKQLNKRLDELTRQEKELEDKIETQNRKISSDKNRTIETLGVFVALFTFISGQVQLFQKLEDPHKIIALSLTTGGLITFFVLILDLMIRTHDEAEGLMKTRFFLLLGLSVSLIVAGSLLISGS